MIDIQKIGLAAVYMIHRLQLHVCWLSLSYEIAGKSASIKLADLRGFRVERKCFVEWR
jgi:hypothetical protein